MLKSSYLSVDLSLESLGEGTEEKEGSEFGPALSLFSSFPSLFLCLSLPQICCFIHPSHFFFIEADFFLFFIWSHLSFPSFVAYGRNPEAK